ncbi:purple acid phosphatase family protein [Marinicella meishanensis]|uniref:purple acid phosphatase family protein n=1 Tax=Marinicella meishanensis TaxID=2873263 RepID=UPI001CBE1538|nr:metallophosphoesterase family protein [Marinicella sp. NBU2979]
MQHNKHKQSRVLAWSLLGWLLSNWAQASELIRGPYIQNQSPTSVTLRWRTHGLTDSVVMWGLAPGQLNESITQATPTTEHEVTITGLTPNQRYHYAVGSSAEILAGNDANHALTMPPTHGTAQPLRIWVLGDSGTANANAAAVRDAYLNFNGNQHTHLWLMLGDNAYSSGTEEQYQAAVFDMYPSLLRQSSLWPVIGNHDVHNANSLTGTGVYYDIFTLPKQARTTGHSTGVDSGSEAYYSFDYGNVHFVMLDSVFISVPFRAAMIDWLQADLMMSQADWTIAMWHHPPYTKGSHDSDLESRHIWTRETVLPILEQHGVDLILGGHSHSYERSWLIDGHYGLSQSFDPQQHVLDGTNGNPFAGETYFKPTLGAAPHEGSVYVVAGSSGKVGNIEPNPHPAMRHLLALQELGSLVIDVSGHHLLVQFLLDNGQVQDVFRLTKQDLIFATTFN